MLPKPVWAFPKLGTFNLHASLLPQYRGAAPINWAIINGESETGLTTFFLQDRVDTGDIILQKSLSIGPSETAGELHERMKISGAELVVETVSAISKSGYRTVSQTELISQGTLLKPAPKIYTSHCRIDWNRPASEIYNLIRGLCPVPAAFTGISLTGDETSAIKIFRAGIEKPGSGKPPGTLLTDRDHDLRISSADGDVCIYELQLSGRKVMKTEEFLRGFGRRLT